VDHGADVRGGELHGGGFAGHLNRLDSCADLHRQIQNLCRSYSQCDAATCFRLESFGGKLRLVRARQEIGGGVEASVVGSDVACNACSEIVNRNLDVHDDAPAAICDRPSNRSTCHLTPGRCRKQESKRHRQKSQTCAKVRLAVHLSGHISPPNDFFGLSSSTSSSGFALSGRELRL